MFSIILEIIGFVTVCTVIGCGLGIVTSEIGDWCVAKYKARTS